MSERFFRFNSPGYPHLVCSEVENSDIGVAVGDCSVAESRRWRPPYQTCKTVQCTRNTHYKHYEDGNTAPGVRGHGSVPLRYSGNVVTRIGLHTKKNLYFDKFLKKLKKGSLKRLLSCYLVPHFTDTQSLARDTP